MKSLYKTLIFSGVSLVCSLPVMAHGIKTKDLETRIEDNHVSITADILLDSLRLSSNGQMLITPVISRDSIRKELPSILVSGRNMHLVYERGALRNSDIVKNHTIAKEIKRKNGTLQNISYSYLLPLEDWMRSQDAEFSFIYDECGCGSIYGSIIGEAQKIYHNPVDRMKAAMITPAVTALPIQKHEGRARVQFEVNKTILHADPYVCRNGQRIDNRAQIAMIDDSVKYALTDPNVELAGIRICGYASPESPYIHNQQLASGRSRALAEYLGERYNLPKENVEYAAIAENWAEFREEVVKSKEINEEQRKALLELIDAPASAPADYDRKEQILKSDPRFAKLYKSKILPEWFPRLRATTFEIRTRLKPMSDEKLAEVLESTPEKMSLNQMFRVARLYPERSEEFNSVIRTALRYYPDDTTAIINAAVAYIDKGDYAAAKQLLAKAEKTPEVMNILGIIATAEENFDLAKEYFHKAGDNEEAKANLQLLK